jgi:biopolymer transport protein ExbD
MSDRRGGLHKHPAKEQDFELNIASVIDCFTVLITYLLVSASFISISALDIDIAGAGDAPQTEPPPVSIAVNLEDNHSLLIKVTGAERDQWVVEAKDGTWDTDSLSAKLQSLHDKWPTVNSALMGADDSMEYKEIVKVVESAKKALPNITLGDKT